MTLLTVVLGRSATCAIRVKTQLMSSGWPKSMHCMVAHLVLVITSTAECHRGRCCATALKIRGDEMLLVLTRSNGVDVAYLSVMLSGHSKVVDSVCVCM